MVYCACACACRLISAKLAGRPHLTSPHLVFCVPPPPHAGQPAARQCFHGPPPQKKRCPARPACRRPEFVATTATGDGAGRGSGHTVCFARRRSELGQAGHALSIQCAVRSHGIWIGRHTVPACRFMSRRTGWMTRRRDAIKTRDFEHRADAEFSSSGKATCIASLHAPLLGP